MAMEGHAWQILSDEHLGAVMSSFFVEGVATVGLLVVAAVALRFYRRHRRAAVQADASWNPAAALWPGEAVVMGTVEQAQGSSMTVSVRIEQEGTEHEGSSIWTHK